MQVTALRNIVAASKAQGVDPGLVLPMRELMESRVAGGFGGDDLAGLIELIGGQERTG